ncbi:MAG TPA: hypothetical protein VKP58_13515 [Candidatus Acidoferrum sp.]|nr:hypothetical protein [Candidatus Acidoferrum sp.]
MKIIAAFALFLATLLSGTFASGQTRASLPEIDPPILQDVPPATGEDLFQHAPVPNPAPPILLPWQGEWIEPGSPADQYRIAAKALAGHKHQFVHCKLQNGKVLTGLIRDLNDQGFSLHTNALGGTYIHYTNLAEPPRVVPAVGTRIKQGAQWTGVGVGIAVAIPLAIPLCLIFLPFFAVGAFQD